MASISDVVEKLDTVNKTLAFIQSKTADTIAATDSVDADVKVGLAATVDSLNKLGQINAASVELLYHLTQQADAIICVLEHISQNTCAILTHFTMQTPLQT